MEISPPPTREMSWRSPGNKESGTKILYLNIAGAWKPYTACSQYKVPDYQIPGGSAGFATFQRLLKAGWKLVPAPTAED